jgi:hypothetical protein
MSTTAEAFGQGVEDFPNLLVVFFEFRGECVSMLCGSTRQE